MKINKTLILNKIQEHYKFKNDSDFANFLEIKPQVLSNWKARNTFDIEILYTKCLEINPDFLIKGLEPLTKENVDKNKGFKNQKNSKKEPLENDLLQNPLINAHLKTISVLEKVVTDLRSDKDLLKQIIQSKLL